LPFQLPNLMTETSSLMSSANTWNIARTCFDNVRIDNQDKSELVFDLESKNWFLNGKNLGRTSPFSNMSGSATIPFVGYGIQNFGLIYLLGYDSSLASDPTHIKGINKVFSILSKVTDTEEGVSFYKQLETYSPNFSNINFNQMMNTTTHFPSSLYPQAPNLTSDDTFDLSCFINEIGKYNLGLTFMVEGNGDLPYVGKIQVTGAMAPVFNIIVKARPVKIDNSKENLTKVLFKKHLIGLGDPNAEVFVKDSISDTLLGTATADDQGNFDVLVPNVQLGEKLIVTEKNATDIGTGKSISNGVEVNLPNNIDNTLNITKQPKYVVMDPNGKTPTFVDENGKTPEISGAWFNASGIYDTSELVRVKGTAEDKAIWYGDYTNEIFYGGAGKINTFTNQSMVPAFTNTAQWGAIAKVLPTNKELVAYMGQKNTGDKWTYAGAIPLYIKAPKVSVKTDEA
ncbi:hypothetical protein PFZ79_002787, partial [Enterococcus hirae]|nr:hypothetical protein [Enterococcus hirae]